VKPRAISALIPSWADYMPSTDCNYTHIRKLSGIWSSCVISAAGAVLCRLEILVNDPLHSLGTGFDAKNDAVAAGARHPFQQILVEAVRARAVAAIELLSNGTASWYGRPCCRKRAAVDALYL
jgi:hypothetical protein